MPTARDAKRSSDAYQITLALAIYYDDHDFYPVYLGNDPQESWTLLKDTLESDYMQEVPVDPAEDQGYYYRYWSDG